MSRPELTIDVDMNGIDEAIEKSEHLAEALADVPPQVVIKHNRDCTFNIYPKQTIVIRSESKENQ